jgi:putative signal transducing protein
VILLVRTDRTQAYLLKDILAINGIKAHVFNENMSSIVGDIPPEVALPQVWLDDDADNARAVSVLRDHYAARNRPGVFFCRGCREENPATFEICWNCGSAL